jgi:ADP-heptose:LPS heptosyltransferase
MAANDDQSRFLIIRLSALGDVVFALETLAALHAQRPQARIDWVVEDRCAEVVSGHPHLTRVVVYPRRQLVRCLRRPWLWPKAVWILLRHRAALRAVAYDAAFDLQGNTKSAMHLWSCRARRKLGFAGAREGAQWATTERVAPPPPGLHRALRTLHLLPAIGLEARPASAVLPPLPPVAESFWNAVPGSGPRVVMVPGSSAFGAFKRWPPERYGAVARKLGERRDARLAVSFGPGEEHLAEVVRELAGERVALLDGARHGLPGLMAILGAADLVIGGDTGPVHLAGVAGVPALAIFGPKDPARYGPRAAGSRVLRHPVPCSPCTLRQCPAPLCVLGVRTETVADAALAMLANGGEASG